MTRRYDSLSVRLAALVALACTPRSARAQTRPPGPPIVDNHYQIDLSRSIVIGSGRAVSMGGAYTSILEALDGMLWNPAAVAVRPTGNTQFVKPDSASSLSVFSGDVGNAGAYAPNYSRYIGGVFGAGIMYNNAGIGNTFEFQSYTLDPGSAGRPINVLVVINHLGFGYSFFRSQLVLGVAHRFSHVAVQAPINNVSSVGTLLSPEISYDAHQAEIGGIWRPSQYPIRLGFAYRTGAIAHHGPNVCTDTEGVERSVGPTGDCSSRGLILPEAILQPWSIDMGFSVQFGRRPYNPPWEDPEMDDDELERRQAWEREQRTAAEIAREEGLSQTERAVAWREFRAREQGVANDESRHNADVRRHAYEARVTRYRAWSRRYLILAMDLEIVGATRDGHGIDAFLQQVEHPAGRSVTFSPRIGLETELIDNRLRVRGGAYLEPSRYEGASARPHATLGSDLRLFYTDVFGLFPHTGIQLSGMVDVAPNYFDFGGGIGFWM